MVKMHWQLILALFSSLAFALPGDPVITSGGMARTFFPVNLMNQCYLLTGSVNPTTTATNGPACSMYLSTSGTAYVKQDAGTTTNWTALGSGGGGGGTVSSVTFTGDGILFTATPSSPVTTMGTLTPSLISQGVNTVLAGPSSGGSATPTFRSLVAADVPILNQNTTGTAANITATTNLTLTTLPSLSLPFSQVTGAPSAAYVVSGSLGSPISISTSGITAGTSQRQMVFVNTAGGSVTVTANPQISAGTIVGQELVIVGTSSSNYPVFNDGTGLSLNGIANLTNNSVLNLFWDGSVWHEQSRR